MIVIDASVIVDYYAGVEYRRRTARRVVEEVEGLPIYEPRLFLVELLAVLSRYMAEAGSLLRRFGRRLT